MERCNTEPAERLDELCEEINREGNMSVSITHGEVRRTLYTTLTIMLLETSVVTIYFFPAECDQFVTDGYFQKYKSLKACEK